MIKKLRWRFIGISMISIFVVLFLILAFINTFNFFSFNNQQNEIIQTLGENNGQFPSDENAPEDGEAPFSTRYFIVIIGDGEILSIDMTNIVKVTTEEASKVSLELYNNNLFDGYYNYFRYKAFKKDNGTYLYVFVDAKKGIDQTATFLINSILIGIAGMVIFFGLVFVFSIIVFKPIKDSFYKQKLFITNASHELKTPLAVINANNEILEMEHGEEEWIKSTKKQIAGMDELIRRLITLSKIDEEGKEDFAIIDISRILINAKNAVKSLEVTMNKPIEVSIENELFIKGSEKDLYELFTLLIENSLKYALDNTTIKIDLRRKKKTAVFIIKNESNNFTTGNLNYLFERFYRSDNDSNKSGFGIGLSIAKSIVDNHKGKITCQCEDNKYVIFTAIFPLTK